MAEVAATQVKVALKAAGSVAEFAPGSPARASLESSMKQQLSCYPPACLLELRVTAGSVNLEAVLTIPNTGGGGTASDDDAAVASSVLAAATSLASQPVAALSASLAVTILEAPVPPTVQANVAVLIAVAPPPPPPEPPEPPPPPSPPMNVQCGCDNYRNGVSTQASSYCVKVENKQTVCYSDNGGCSGDMTRCPAPVNTCTDAIKAKKCARKKRKGRCAKRNIAQIKCRLTCGTCSPGVYG